MLEPGDLIIDGGNTKFTEDEKHAKQLDAKGIGFMDVGVSGGVWGLENGYGLMVGGSDEQVQRLDAGLRRAAPRGTARGGLRARGPGRRRPLHEDGPQRDRVRDHAGVRRGLRAARRVDDSGIDVPGTFKAWQRGTVVRSWLLELMVRALDADPDFAEIDGYVDDSGEGRWTLEEAIDHAVPMPAISASIFARFVSRQEQSPAMKAVAALRNQFGGHAVKAAEVEGRAGDAPDQA